MRVPVFRLLAAVIVALAILSTPQNGSASSAVLLTGFPLLKQQHMLTCEASAASMATKAVLTETQIMARMPRSADPNVGFRGSIDGLPDKALWNYGVYAAPIQRVLAGYGYTSKVLQNATNADVKAYINKGWPVILWLTYALQKATPRLGMAGGRPYVLVPHEHAILAVGYDSGTVVANDPWLPKVVHYRWAAFDRSWALFRNMALAVDPCPAPSPISGLALKNVTTERMVWTWNAATNAAQYHVTVRLRGPAAPSVLFDGMAPSPRYVLLSPTPGSTYQVVVRSVSTCGEQSKARETWVAVPVLAPQSTVTPSPTAGRATATPQPTAAATARAAR
jgi:uncharacterized protein YvpB